VHSRPERVRSSLALLLLLGAALCAAPRGIAQQAEPPQLEQVAAARQALRDDPNLGLERTLHTLRWHSSDEEPEEKAAAPGWLQWVFGLFKWIGQSGRFMVWVLAGLLAAAIVIYLLRMIRDRRPSAATGPTLAPTHVRELDIRPESLPADIGAAARALWDGGDSRRALALLYRGMLSRLAHAHAAPVRESTTEGESVALARGCLPASGGDFADALVRTWQFAVYGGRMPDTTRVHALCAGFAPALDGAAAPGSRA
jgi:hypothetical protein